MQISISEQLQTTINIISSKFESIDEIERFESASKELDELIQKGIIPKKEYNLLTSSERDFPQMRFNVTKPSSPVNGNLMK